jgi:hypothetical protein
MHYEIARHFKGEMVRFRTEKGDWRIGRVVNVTKDGVQIEKLIDNSNKAISDEGYGFPWGPPGPWDQDQRFCWSSSI